ncbi:MAG: LemA family protein [Candidatus Margulisiibacteriota bacterium]
MSKKWIWIIGIIAAAVIIGGWVIGVYNNLVGMDVSVKASWAQVENQYQRRLDLIPNLVETVKGYKIHETEAIKNVSDARARLAGAASTSDKVSAANGLEGALSRLLMIVENYPNLKADANFRQLSDSLEGTENRIAVERMRYNETVKNYNIAVRRFPTSIFAGMFGFDREKTLFKAAEGANEVPKVKF